MFLDVIFLIATAACIYMVIELLAAEWDRIGGVLVDYDSEDPERSLHLIFPAFKCVGYVLLWMVLLHNLSLNIQAVIQ